MPGAEARLVGGGGGLASATPRGLIIPGHDETVVAPDRADSRLRAGSKNSTANIGYRRASPLIRSRELVPESRSMMPSTKNSDVFTGMW